MTRDLLHLAIPFHGVLGVLAVLLAIVAVRVRRARLAALALWVPVTVGLVIYPAFRVFDKPLLVITQLGAFERKEYLALSAVALGSAGVLAGRLGEEPLAVRLLATAALFASLAASLGIYAAWCCAP